MVSYRLVPGSELAKLQHHLAEIPAGPVGEVGPLEELLAKAWDELDGNDAGGMQAYKLLGRTEEMKWNAPLLTFDLERHGGAALGSTRAEIQSWTIDIVAGTASMMKRKGFRQVHPREPNWNANAVAKELAQPIVAEQRGDSRLLWNEKGQVRPNIGRILPRSVRQTREGRSKRLWAALIVELRPHGWVKVQRHFEKAK